MNAGRHFGYGAFAILWIFGLLNSVSFESEKVVVRPSFEKIHALIIQDNCFIKKSSREKLADALRRLDEIHSLYLDRFGFTRQSPPNTRELIKKKTGILPPAIPLCERTIVYSLYLQIEMLDLVLKNRDINKAQFLGEKRRKKKIISNDKRIYGDYKDVYFFMVIDLLGDISKLHHGLGMVNDINFDFPAKVDQNDVEGYLLEKIKQVSNAAKKLLDKQ